MRDLVAMTWIFKQGGVEESHSQTEYCLFFKGLQRFIQIAEIVYFFWRVVVLGVVHRSIAGVQEVGMNNFEYSFRDNEN